MSTLAQLERKLHISWGAQEDRIYAVAYMDGLSSIDYRITDYSIYLSDVQRLDNKTVKTEIYHLKSFFDHLAYKRIQLKDVSDKVLSDFRDVEHERVIKSNNSSGSVKCAQRTVNAKLRRAYLFLMWAQNINRSISGVIGIHGHPVTSNLSEQVRTTKVSGRRTRISREQEFFPLQFRNTGARTRHGTQYEATDEDIILLSEFFCSNFSSYVSQRNILMMDLAANVSWRRASVNSLTCEQFKYVSLKHFSDDFLSVIPSAQKFGYERAFEVPFTLAFRVSEFISSARRGLLDSKGFPESNTEGRVFVSERTGRPLEDGSVSQIFARAFKAIGRPRGANFHSFRRKFANDLIEQEIRCRLDLGLDTGALSIAAAVAQRMGHASPESLAPYVSRRLARLGSRLADRKDSRIRTLEDENRSLRLEIARLQTHLKD